MSDPYEEVAYIQRGFSTGLLSRAQVKEALDLYARSVEFCNQRGFPVSCIRIEAQASELTSTRTPTGTIRVERVPIVTVLRFNGTHWQAARVVTVGLHPALEGELVRGYLSLSSLFTAL